MDLPTIRPDDVRVKEYKKGWAVELSYNGEWKNLHALMEDFPKQYYFDNEEQAKQVADKIKKIK